MMLGDDKLEGVSSNVPTFSQGNIKIPFFLFHQMTMIQCYQHI
jgi:hypothetical protein